MKPFALLALLLLASPARSPAAEPQGSEIPVSLPTAEAVQAWADRHYFGGNRVQELSRGGKKALVVLGHPTSGVVSTVVVPYSPTADGAWTLQLLRTIVFGVVCVSEGRDGLEFRLLRTPAPAGAPPPELVLAVPWAGLPPITGAN